MLLAPIVFLKDLSLSACERRDWKTLGFDCCAVLLLGELLSIHVLFRHPEVNSTLRSCLSQSSEHLCSAGAVNGVPVIGEVQSPFL